jgi:hypothetical protein
MANIDFTATTEAHFNGVPIVEIYLGVQKVWPTQPAVHNVTNVISARNIGFEALAAQAEIDYYIDPADMLQATLPAGTSILVFEGMDDQAIGNQVFAFGTTIVSKALDSEVQWGHNKDQDAYQGNDVNGQGQGWATRYGGQWVFPSPVVAGDILYITLADTAYPGAYVSVLKITVV